MSVNRLFDTVEAARETAHWQAAFGEPQEIGDRTIIPVAQVGYGFGLGFGSGTGSVEKEGDPPSTGEGGGTGGCASAKPLGAIVVTPEQVYFEEIQDEGKVALFGVAMVAFSIYQVAKTLRAIFGPK
ncbi:MAG TPA: spore germination protein GerW family protein [Anaerolineae bacterium]|nr:spore germination protein GerW family protein [Anaerolineae bacterium]